MEQKKSFTVIELLIVITIISILSLIMLANYRGGQAQLALQRASHKLAQDIRRVQEMATSTREFQGVVPSGGYGIHFTLITLTGPDHYILFADCNGNHLYDEAGTPCNGFPEKVGDSIELEEKVEISALSSSPLNIVFIPPDPQVFISAGAETAEITLSLKGDITKTKKLSVNKIGLIEITD